MQRIRAQIIAAKANQHDVEQFSNHAVNLRRSGKLIICNNEHNAEQIPNTVFAFISQPFIEDARCQQEAIVAAYDKKLIIPILLDICSFQDLKYIAGKQIIPRRGSIHVSFSRNDNADEGWAEVVKELYALITPNT